MKKYLLLGLIIALTCATSTTAFGKKQDVQEQKVNIKTNPAMESFVTRSIDGLSKREHPADLILEKAFLNVVLCLSTEEQYLKLNKKIHSISRNPKYDLTKKNEKITKIINDYNKKLDKNQIGYIAAISRLSDKELLELRENLNILSLNGQHYVNLVLQARDNERQITKISNRPDNYEELKTSINSKGNEIRGKANAALNLAIKVRTLVKYAGINFN